ncbi:hypothetical protein SDC9_58919 [bioreactor metagenome]|uniref:Secretion system C-terminal sorting domain-containing protein n=1 Tax=bioreactor metagenome TaxID=1076179 RepID=A0A644X8Q2_9ZZZZ
MRDIYVNPGFEESGKSGNSIRIYPVPAQTFINLSVDGSGSFSSLRVSNMMGQTVLEQEWTNDSVTINVNDLPAGMYNIILYGNDKLVAGSFIKQ